MVATEPHRLAPAPPDDKIGPRRPGRRDSVSPWRCAIPQHPLHAPPSMLRGLAVLLALAVTGTGCDGEPPSSTEPAPRTLVVETDLASRVVVAEPTGDVSREGGALRFAESAGLDLYVVLSAGSHLVADVDGGEARVEVANEAGRRVVAERVRGAFDTDLKPLGAGLARVRVVAGPDGARISALQIAAPPHESSTSTIARGPYDVLVILFDSLRADELGSEGPDTPTLDALAKGGVSFTEARAPASWTRPSVATLLTSVSPSTHRISLLTESLPDGVPLLSEVLARAGYYTASLTHSSQVAPRFGFDRGFDRVERFYARASFQEYHALRTPLARAEWVWDKGLSRVIEAAGERPWFVYLHEMDPHDPYEPPAPYDTRYTPSDVPEDAPTGPAKYIFGDVDNADIARLHGLYRGEIAFMDVFLGALLERVRAAQAGRKTLVVFVSDHGEAFGEQGQLGHAQVVAEHQLRVPLILNLEGVLPAGLRVETAVELADVAPTVLDLVGVAPDPRMEGRSLLPLVAAPQERPTGPRAFFAEAITRAEVGVRVGRWKLVQRTRDVSNEGRGLIELGDVDPSASAIETALYDLAEDPEERIDVAAEHPFVEDALSQLLAWHEHLVTTAPSTPTAEIGDEEREHLKALGYIDESDEDDEDDE